MTDEPALISAEQIVEPYADLPADARAQLVEVLAWLRTAIARPDPRVGRKGHVCPFVQPGLTRFGSIRFHVYQGELHPTAAAAALRALAARFPTQLPTTGSGREFRAILTLFPGLPNDAGPWFIDPLQKALKPEITAQGLMIGQFYPGCREPGLHNLDYRPLEAPHPMLVIRPMQLTDLMFLFARPEYLTAYIGRFGITSRDELTARLTAAGIPQLPALWESALDAAFPQTHALRVADDASLTCREGCGG